jgi:acid stress-induced BolA-like protein IbaG/YrbA
MIDPHQVESMIKVGLPDAQVQAISSDGEHYEVVVVSAEFAGKGRVQQHQLVYKALGEVLATGALHAVSLKTLTPEDWAAMG